MKGQPNALFLSIKSVYPFIEVIVYLLSGIFLYSLFFLSSQIQFAGLGEIGPYKTNELIPILSLVLGSLLPHFLGNPTRLYLERVFSMVLLGFTGWLLFYFHRPSSQELLFHGLEFLLIFSIGVFILGYIFLYSASYGFRILLVGILLGSAFFKLIPIPIEYYKIFIIFTFGLGILKTFFFSNSLNLLQLLPKIKKNKSYKIYNEIFLSFILLYFIWFVFSIYRGSYNIRIHLPLLTLSYLLGYWIFEYVSINYKNYRNSILTGIHALGFSFLLFALGFSFPQIEFAFVLFCGIGLGFYYQENKIKLFSKLQTIFLFLLSLIIIWIGLYFSQLKSIWIHLLVILSLIFPFLVFKEKNLNLTAKFLPILSYGFLSFFFLKAPSGNTLFNPPIQKKPLVTISPNLFLFSNLFGDNTKIISIGYGIPANNHSMEFLPINELKEKIPIIYYHPEYKLIDLYLKYLIEYSKPFYLTYEENKNLEYNFIKYKKEFPGFTIYYSHPELEPDWNPSLSRDWKFQYILSKIDNEQHIPNIAMKLSHIERYGGYEILKEVQKFQELAKESILNFCNYYYINKFFFEALNCYHLASLFRPLDPESNSKAYNSFLQTSPIPELLPFLEELAKIPEYKTSIYKSIYPVYIAIQNHDAAIRILESLMDSQSISDVEKENLELEIVRLLLDTTKLEKAYFIIQSNLRKNSENLLWQRLMDEYYNKLELRRNEWSPKPTVDTSKIE